MTPDEFLRSIPIGTRVVVRYLLDDGRATDALGHLRARDAEHVVVETKRGLDTVALATVIAAKEVPPPPAPAAALTGAGRRAQARRCHTRSDSSNHRSSSCVTLALELLQGGHLRRGRRSRSDRARRAGRGRRRSALELREASLERGELLLRGAQLGAAEPGAAGGRGGGCRGRGVLRLLPLARAQPQVLVDAARQVAQAAPSRIAYCWSVTRSMRYRSCETTRSVPGQESSRSSIAASMSVSRSLVGSSRISTFGSLEQDQQQLQAALLPAREVLRPASTAARSRTPGARAAGRA